MPRRKASYEAPALLLYCAAGYLRDVEGLIGSEGASKIVSTLVFHQVPLEEKRRGFIAILAALKPGGELHVADYGLQRTAAMKTLFGLVQLVDGFADTRPNAKGVLPRLMKEAGLIAVEETKVFPTATGSISLYRAVKLLAGQN